MTRDEFASLVQDVERRAARHPVGFKIGVGGMALLGFGFLLLVLFLTVGGVAALGGLVVAAPSALTIKLGLILGIPLGAFAWALVCGLFVRVPRPQGRRLRRAEVPALFAEVEKLRRQVGAPRLSEILLTPDHNAGITQTPRLGVFGWHRNSLLLGLPLLQGVTTEEFRAILAHEMAHLSGSHGKFGAWIYRVRRSWERVFEELQRQRRGSSILGPFLRWFWPRFNARAFVLSRAQEYQADAIAARATSAAALRLGLIRTQVQGRWLDERFWPELFSRASALEGPPAGLYRELGAGLVGLHADPDAVRWLSQAFRFETNLVDTHPSLHDRVTALQKIDPALDETEEPAALALHDDAATFLLGEKLESLVAELSQGWAEQVRRNWQQRHAETQKLTEELAKHAGKDLESMWERARIIMERDGDEKARDLFEQVLARDPDHAAANFALGRLLLKHDEARGVELLERAVSVDVQATTAATELLYGYFARQGEHEKLRALEKRLDAHNIELEEAQKERAIAHPKDIYLMSTLKPEEIAHAREVFARHKEIAAAYVGQKFLRHFPETPMFVVVLKLRGFRLTNDNPKLVSAVANELSLRGNWIVFTDQGSHRALARAVRAAAGDPIYERPKK